MIEDLIGHDESKRRKALEKVYHDYFPAVRAFVLRHRGIEDDALDVFQEGVLALYMNLKSGVFRNDASIKTYLFKICQNKWYAKYNADMKNEKMSLDDNSGDEINTNLISKLMSDLSPDCGKMLIGFYYKRKSMLELMKEFDLGSVQAAKNKKLRCLKYLMNLIKDKGLTYQNFVLDK